MKKAAVACIAFFVLFLAGVTTCVPGICSCAFSWLPEDWEPYYAIPALVADLVGLLGCFISGAVFLLLVTRKATIQDTAKRAEEQGHNRPSGT